MNPILLSLIYPAASWAISGIITVTWIKSRLQYMERDIEATNRHLESSDGRHEELRREFNEHRIEMAKKVH